MSLSNYDDVGEFHERFDLDNTTHRGVGPRDVDPDLMAFRIRFLHEELREFEVAVESNDRVQQFDALLDLVYVAMGTAHLLGLPWQAGWDEVQRANLTKIRAAADGSDSVRGSAFDVVKPEGWQPPDLERVLNPYIVTGYCNYCGRDLTETVLLHKPLSSVPGITAIHCACGAYVSSRPTVTVG